MVVDKNKDDKKRVEITELLNKSTLPEELKDEIKSFIEEINNGELENLFKMLKERLKQENDESS